MDDAKQPPRSFLRRVGDFFYNWANGSEWSQLDAIMLAVGLWLLGCLVIGGFFAANWVQSLTPNSKKHEMYAQGYQEQPVESPNQATQPVTPTAPKQPVQMQAQPMAPMPQYSQGQVYAQASAPQPPQAMSMDGSMDAQRSNRIYSNRHSGIPAQVQIAPPQPHASAYQAAYANHLAAIQQACAPRYQHYELLCNQRQLSNAEIAQRFGAPRANAEFPTTVNWQPFGRSTSGEANAFGAP